ncbi:hypothetical protein GCM10027443_13900 [Pontibacter brevis]
MKINFISTEDLNIVSGGWSGINCRLIEQLSKFFEINYIGPIKPTSFPFEKLVSKIKRIAGFRGSFHFLSEKRLDLVKNIVLQKLSSEAEYNFFFGQMPWTNCYFDKPYGVYLDACFPTYLEVYSKPNQFEKKDIARISALEKQWLLNANHLFFGSFWALHEAEKHYSCKFNNAEVVWVGGNIAIPQVDKYERGLDFLFISLNFEKKGGYVCVETIQKIREIYPEATLTIIGQQPPASILSLDGIIYAGLLNKKDPKDLVKFIGVLEKAFFLIHPTVMDTMGAVIIEAGYYGCPSIAPKSFGIPELIKDNESGILIDAPFNAGDFAQPLLELIKHKSRYSAVRHEVRKFTTNRLTWNAVGDRIINSVCNSSSD